VRFPVRIQRDINRTRALSSCRQCLQPIRMHCRNTSVNNNNYYNDLAFKHKTYIYIYICWYKMAGDCLCHLWIFFINDMILKNVHSGNFIHCFSSIKLHSFKNMLDMCKVVLRISQAQ